jgi:1,4-alpha-glucan branching enzyme
MIKPTDASVLEAIVQGSHHDPHSVLGAHPHGKHVTFRVLRPLARSVSVTIGASVIELEHEAHGIWVGASAGTAVPDYRLSVDYGSGAMPADDPYRFLPSLGELDLHLIGEGRHERLWDVLGAQVRSYDTEMGPVHGTAFAVWAPNAVGVRVVGDFNSWDGTSTPMRSLGSSGVWELFIPFVGDGAFYKFEILGRDGVRRLKTDPMARAMETAPSNAARVTTTNYQWQDQEWIAARSRQDQHAGPMSIYEVHLGSWRKGLSYRELAIELVEYVATQGFTHVELLPVMEHPFEPSWGYHVTGYFAPSSRQGSPDDFRHLVDSFHHAGIGVILDWVPAHFATDDWALARFDGSTLYEHSDPQRGEHPEWGSLIFDYGRPEVRNFLVANAVYWLEEFHGDGLRVDGVASMLYLDYSREDGQWSPNQFGGRENLDAVNFLQEMNATVYKRVPGVVTIAEESTSWPGVTKATDAGGLGFGFKWNMGWMHDTLQYIAHDPVHRVHHHDELTFAFVYQWSENFILPLSHDEVVHGKGSLIRRMPGDRWQQMATLRAYLAYMWAHPGKQLLFMGGEWGQWSEWSQEHGLDWWLLENSDHRGIQKCVADMNHLYRSNSALWSRDGDPAGFEWIIGNGREDNVLAWLRRDQNGTVASITNFSPVPRLGYRIGLPQAGRWDEILNTDASGYEGSGVGNLGGVDATQQAHHGWPACADVVIPPLSTIWLRPGT